MMKPLELQTLDWQKWLDSEWPGLDLKRFLEAPQTLDRTERSVFRGLCMGSLHFTTVFALGYDLLGLRGSVHAEMCQQLQDASRPQMHLRYRGFYKSTIGSIAHPIWRAMNDVVDYSYLIITSDEPLVRARMRDIKRRIMRPQVQVLFPELAIDQGEKADHQFSCVGREADGPGFMMRTTLQSLAGRHPHHMNFDDLVNEKNYKSRDEQDRLKKYFDESQPTVRAVQLVTMEATPYAAYDATHHIIEVMYPEFMDLYVTPVRGDVEIGPTGRLLFVDGPEYAFPVDSRVEHEDQWDDEKFREERFKYRKHPFIFRAQYLMDTSYTEGESFLPAWLKHRKRPDLRYFTRYMSVDPASGMEGGSKLALALIGYAANGEFQVLEARDHYAGLPELLEDMFALFEAYRPSKVGIETYAGIGATFWEQVRRQMRERGVYMPLEKQTHAKESKDEHILEALQAPYKWGNVWHDEGLQGGRYETQLLDFPSAEYKDLLDAVAYAFKLGLTFGYRGPAQGEADVSDDVKKLPDMNDRLNDRIRSHREKALAGSEPQGGYW